MMAGWRRSTAQNPMSQQNRIYTRQQGGINTAGRIYGGDSSAKNNISVSLKTVQRTDRKQT